MKPLKVRILGSGKAAQKQRMAFGQLPRRFEVVESIYTGPVDITSICTPHFRHFCDVFDAIEHSHVMVEKPMCQSLWHADRLQEAMMTYGHHIFPVFQYRYAEHSPFEDAVVIEFQRDQSYWKTGWRNNWEEGLGGAVTHHGLHGLDIIVERFGMPNALNAQLWGPKDVAVETRAIIAMQWPSGSICTLGVAADAAVGQNEDPCSWRLGDTMMGYRGLFERIYLTLCPGAEPPPPVPLFHDGRNSVELLTAIYKSHAYGHWVTLPVRSKDPLYRGWVPTAKAWYGTPEPLSQASH